MISIVVPARNEENNISRCIESLKGQEYKDSFEIIVVNNGSEDRTAEIARTCGAKVVNCAVIGIVDARQTGAVAASGDIVIQADADTIYPSDWLTGMVGVFISRPEIVAVTGAYRYLEPRYWAPTEYALRNACNRLFLFLFNKPIFVSGANFAFRREAFIRAAGYERTSLYPDQWGISYRLSKIGKVIYDRNIVAYTSVRRVEKPLVVLLYDTMRNFAKASWHFLKYISGEIGSPLLRISLPENLARYINQFKNNVK